MNTDQQTRGPVIFAGLYAACIFLTIQALFLLERFGATDFRAWAPFLQAILSGLAIFAAWWLQDRKHRVEADEKARNAAMVFAGVSRTVVRHAIFLRERCRSRTLSHRTVTGHLAVLSEDIQYLRSFPLAEIRDPSTLRAAIEFIRSARIYYVTLGRTDRAYERNADLPRPRMESRVIDGDQLDDVVERLTTSRSNFVKRTSYRADHPLWRVGKITKRRGDGDEGVIDHEGDAQ